MNKTIKVNAEFRIIPKEFNMFEDENVLRIRFFNDNLDVCGDLYLSDRSIIDSEEAIIKSIYKDLVQSAKYEK